MTSLLAWVVVSSMVLACVAALTWTLARGPGSAHRRAAPRHHAVGSGMRTPGLRP